MLSIALDGIKAVERKLARDQAIIVAAANSAINKTAAKVKTDAVKDVSKSKQLPQKIVRSRIILRKSTFRKLYALVTALTAGVPIDRLKYIDTKKKGVTAAGRRFAKAFSGIGRGNNLLVFQRRGATRLPIDRVKIDLNPEATSLIDRRVLQHTRTTLLAHFQREFTRRSN